MEKNNLVECFPLDFTNISVVDAPLVKDYYWEWLGVGRLNRHFLTTRNVCNSVFQILVPITPINSMPVKVILFVNNATPETVNWTIKRKKLCECEIQSVPTGINTFKRGYLCPHRTLLTLFPTAGTVKSNQEFQIQMFFTFGLLGETPLSYELTVDERFRLRLNFFFRITEFNPLTCIVTKQLFPVNVGDVQPTVQPIWVFNHYNQDMEFQFYTDEPGLEIMTNSLLVRKYSLTVLLVKYKPQEVGEKKLALALYFLGIKNDFTILTAGLLFDIPHPISFSPKNDISTPGNPFVLYENAVGLKLKITENSSTMIVVHNFSDKCAYFKWQSYYIEGLFSINVAPNTFTCKPNHSQLCLVIINAENTPCVFPRVPIACEVYKAKQGDRSDSEVELDNVDSDFDGVQQKLLKRLWLNVNFRVENAAHTQIPEGLRSTDDFNSLNFALPRNFDKQIFDKIFWSQIFGIDFLSLVVNKKSEGASYDELFAVRIEEEPFVNRKLTLQILRMLVADAVAEISKRWRFIPIEVAYP